MFKTLTLAAASATFVAGFASAETIERSETIFSDELFVDTVELEQGDQAFLTYNVGEDLNINGVSFAGTGNNNGEDLGTTEFGVTAPNFNEDDPSTEEFDPQAVFTFNIPDNPGSSSASGFFNIADVDLPNNGMFSAGDEFTIFFLDGRNSAVGATNSFQTFSPDVPTIPVPAALPLLAGALGALGLIRRRSAV